jgi:hypothetical protein
VGQQNRYQNRLAMTREQISKIWTVVSLFLLYYAVNTYLVTQGGQPVFGATLISISRIPAATLGIPICSLLLIVCSLIGINYAHKSEPMWAARIPLVAFEKIDVRSREGKIYQGTMLAALTLLPLVSLVHFWNLFATADLVTTKNPAVHIPSVWSWSALTSLDDPARICSVLRVGSNPPGSLSCEGNMSVLPGLEASAFVLVTFAAAVVTIAFWWVVFRPVTSAKRK